MDQVTTARPVQSFRNRLLELLPPADLEFLRPHLKKVKLTYRLPLYEAHEHIDFVYFPVTGVASLVNTMADGSASEVGTIGNEGMIGLPIILGDEIAPTSVYIQVPGEGLRLSAKVLWEALETRPATRKVMDHYVHAFFNQVAQSAACNHFHSLDQRSSVTIAANKLKRLKLIKYHRGNVTILDRKGLEKRTCECYAVSKREFDRLLGPPLGPA
jgi:CRP-like cAMP-binding protein